MDSDDLSLFATAAKGLEELLAAELAALGAADVRHTRSGVEFRGDLRLAYRCCLWSRLAGRILLPLVRAEVADAAALYAAVYAFAWEEHFDAACTLAVDANLQRSCAFTHSRYAALKVKDAVVDRLRDCCGCRPDIRVRQPDWRLNLFVRGSEMILSLDLSGDSLHRRGYRGDGGSAPLKENLAAALLVRAGWEELGRAGAPLYDPMCGSGTLVLEAALMAADIAPGLLRDYFGFLRWRHHDAVAWQELRAEAQRRRAAGLERLPRLTGYDCAAGAIKNAWSNAERAGLQRHVHFERRDLATFGDDLVVGSPGLVITNPPYGERLGEREQLLQLYALLGRRLREYFIHWKAALFTVDKEFGRQLGMRAVGRHMFFNGAIKCMLLHFVVEPENFYRKAPPGSHGLAPLQRLSDGAQMFANRLRKNLKNIGRWARRNGIECYRLYDADLPEYAVAIDIYADKVHVQEYQAPTTVDSNVARRRLREVVTLLPQLLKLDSSAIYVKTRQRQRGSEQYQRHDNSGQRFEVTENGLRFLVNLSDYLDSGLFLDHRITRAMVADLASGGAMLNLFAYTASASVYAAAAGASSTTSVDMSATYCAWARDNLRLNGFTPPQHQVVCADCLQWLRQRQQGDYAVIFLDPPTFSNSKKMADALDIQRDHVELIRLSMKLLHRDGTMIFSNNMRRFKMERTVLEAEFVLEDITAATLPRDFARNKRIHNCWRIRHKT